MSSISKATAVVAENLVKRFGEVEALAGIDLEVPEGTIVAMLGPNGAGKTTAVHILATLLQPDAGHATVAGFDVVRQADEVREVIGLAGQYAAVDDALTGRENLILLAGLFHLPRASLGARAVELLERFGLADAADRPVKTYSGGMRRRLDLAASLVGHPLVLFLDEPTTGLDPRSRLDLWDVIRDLVSGGATILLTTQYLEEADQLADDIVVIDRGRVIATGTSDELKARVGGDVITVAVDPSSSIDDARVAVARIATGTPQIDTTGRVLSVPVGGAGSRALMDAVRCLDAAHVNVTDLTLRRPSLDDVFLALTGHAANATATEDDPNITADVDSATGHGHPMATTDRRPADCDADTAEVQP